jgi:hypothetical protein
MARQRQVDEALRRAFHGSAPLGGQVGADVDGDVVTVRHRENVLLRWSLLRSAVLHEWHETPADKRVLAAAVAALQSGDLAPQESGAPAGGTKVTVAASRPAAQPRKRKRPEVQHNATPMRVTTEKHMLPRSSTAVTVLIGQSVTEKGSRFQAVVAFPVSDQAQAAAALSLLRRHSALGGATHRITAFRAADGTEGCDDDGEDRAGATLRAALRREGFTSVAACVARWYGGVNIGKARFTHIQDCAVRALQAGGLVRGGGGGVADVAWLQAGPGHKLGGAQTTAAPAGPDPASAHAAASGAVVAAAAVSCAGAVDKQVAKRAGATARGTGSAVNTPRETAETAGSAGMALANDRLVRASLCAAAAEKRRQLARTNRAAAPGVGGIRYRVGGVGDGGSPPDDGPLIADGSAAVAAHAAPGGELGRTAPRVQTSTDKAASASARPQLLASLSSVPRAYDGTNLASHTRKGAPAPCDDDEQNEVIEIFE